MELITIRRDKNYIIKARLPVGKEPATAAPPKQQPADFTAAPAFAAGSLYLEDGFIAALTAEKTNHSYRFKHPQRGIKTIILQNLYLIPPLVDCHVHLALDGRRKPEQQPFGQRLQATLQHGILAVRDGGDRRGIAGQIRNLVQAGQIPGPRILAAIHGLRPPQSYGSFLGPDTPMAELPSALERLKQQKADLMKVIVSGVVSFQEYGKVGAAAYTAEELTILVQAAKEQGWPVMAHASSDAAVKMAVQAGVDTIEHGYFLSEATLAQMAARGIAWVPTVVPVAAQLQSGHAEQINRASRYVIEKTVFRQLAMINKAAALGVPLGVGTDAGAAGVEHGSGYGQELELYRQAGLTPAQIYHSATAVSAAILGLSWGRMAPGCPAALIALAENPLQNQRALTQIRYVFLPEQAGSRP